MDAAALTQALSLSSFAIGLSEANMAGGSERGRPFCFPDDTGGLLCN